MALKVGIVGAGAIARPHMRAYVSNENVTEVHVADPSAEARDGLIGEYGIITEGVDDYAKLLADESIDIIDCCAPHNLHHPIAMAAFKAGKHVITEKPIALTIKHADEMVNAAKRAKKRLFVAMNQRMLPAHRKAKEIIDGSSLVLVLDIGAPITLKNFLNIMCSRSEDQLAWIVQDGAVIMTTKAKSLGTPTPRIHEIADLTFPITNFAGPQIKTLPIGGEEDEEEPRAGGEVGDKVRFVEPEALQTLVQESVARGLWGADGVSIEVTGGNMLVVHTPEVQAKVEQFLNDLRKFQTSLVTVESKFLRVDRNWLQEFGVDFRGLGGANAKGTVAQLDDITNGLNNNASRGLDNGGVQDPNAHPNSGFFYDDGLDGDFRGRTENFFQNALGNLLTTTGGATFGFTILDDMQLNVLLRAVEKKLSLEVVDAQTLTVLNGQRANISVINQTSYIKDFAVEVATASFIADPEVDVIQDGVVLDVRPTISYDRKYITLDLQPTVAELVRPIPTFTTSLSGSTLPVTIQFPQMTVRSAATTVKVPDGGSVLIGGLNEVLNRERRAEVPWIANLPLISFLFKQEGVVDENSSLMVLVRGHIINVKEFMDVRTTAGGGTR